ncbi:SOS response-associated peptidase family protein [Variovorax ureilyticus]|uniref:Abasic site processing protein n=1 Tax=Variovorax ureilyticus TaxID=1836198 RepID=A0ABU8VN89_9BURK
MVEGHFGLLPGFAKDAKLGLKTYNARSETVRELASFKGAWAKPRHCIVPCKAIYEPDWRAGKFIPTRFTAANDETLGVAGLWLPWKNPETAEWELSFTMLTINADEHPLFKLMHRPGLKRPPDKQDKRMVAILPEAQYGEWLDAPPERSMDFLLQFLPSDLRWWPSLRRQRGPSRPGDGGIRAGKGRSSPTGRGRVIARQLEALRWLQELVAQDPRPRDRVGAGSIPGSRGTSSAQSWSRCSIWGSA